MSTDNIDTRERLLNAAEELFAERGFDAVSVRDIAAAAESNIAAVNYHFGGKDRLYHGVLRRALERRRDRYVAAMQDAAARSDDLHDIVRAFYRTHLEDTLRTDHGRCFLKLLVREIHHGTDEGACLIQEILLPLWRQVGERLLAAVPGADPELAPWIVGSLHGQMVHFTMRWHKAHDPAGNPAMADTFRALFPPLAGDIDSYIDLAVDHITRFSVAGILAVLAQDNTVGAQPMEPTP
jgi:AcrR family transcriptional regulator